MGVDRGGRAGETSPPEFGVGDANANCPHQILSYRYKKSILWPSKYAKIRFRPGLCPGPCWGAHEASPNPLVGWRGDTPPYTLLGTHPPSALAMRPQEFQLDLRL